jgi:hypothetical protein
VPAPVPPRETAKFASEWRTPDDEYKAPLVEVFAFENVAVPDVARFPDVSILQLLSVMDTPVAEEEPIAMVFATAPVPILTVFAFVAPPAILTVVAPVPAPSATILVPDEDPRVNVPV